MITVNGRFRTRRVTGVERYAQEVCKRLTIPFGFVGPSERLSGCRGHLWEQCILPGICRSGLLWSPCNTGPIVKSNQVVSIHDIAVLEHPEWFSRSFAKVYEWILPNLAKRALHILTGSEFSKGRICRVLKVGEDKVTVIANGVGEEFYPHSEAEVALVRQKWEIATPRYVLTVGSQEPRKNLPGLLAAWKAVAAAAPDVSLIVVGGRSGKHIFREAASDLQQLRVRYLGYTPDDELAALYSGAECFVYPSLYEGFGLPVLEALTCGTRVVTSAGTAMQEFAGLSTILVDPRSVEAIAAAIMRLLLRWREPATESADARFYQSKYKWDSTAARVSDLLRLYAS